MREIGEQKIRSVFKRMEADAEYCARLVARGIPSWRIYGKSSREIDAVGDDMNPPCQRRIVEDVA